MGSDQQASAGVVGHPAQWRVEFNKVGLQQEILLDDRLAGFVVHGDGDVCVTLIDPDTLARAAVARFHLKPPYYATRMEAAMAWCRTVLAQRTVREVIDLLGGPHGPRISPMAYAESLGWDWRGNAVLADAVTQARQTQTRQPHAAASPPPAAALPPPTTTTTTTATPAPASAPAAASERRRPLLPHLPLAASVRRSQP